jgi:hypothetical protein
MFVALTVDKSPMKGLFRAIFEGLLKEIFTLMIIKLVRLFRSSLK